MSEAKVTLLRLTLDETRDDQVGTQNLVAEGERGNRTRVPINRIKHLQTKHVPQRCLMDFRPLTAAPIAGIFLG